MTRRARRLRAIGAIAAAIALAALWQIAVVAQRNPSAAACVVTGRASSRSIPLPGVVLSLIRGGDSVDTTSSAADGTFAIKVPGPGTYTLRGELVAFAPATRELTLTDESCQQHVDLELTLASRAQAARRAENPTAAAANQSGATASNPSASAPANPARQGGNTGGRGQGARGAGGRGQFQSLTLVADQGSAARDDEGANEAIAQALLPPGFAPSASGESVTAIGSTQGSESLFAPGGPGDRFEQLREQLGGVDGAAPGQFGGGPAGRGGFAGRGGPGGDFGGFGGFGGGFGRGRGNRIRGSVYQSFDTSHFDAGPFALNGQPTAKPDYLQQRFGATLGGPLAIPKLFDAGARTFFFLNYTGNHSRTPYDQYSTVPTAAERGGDLSALGKTIIDPVTHQPFAGAQIPSSQIDPAAATLLNLVPLPNQLGATQNFHTISTATNQLDDINVRIIHNFGAPPPQGRGQGRFGAGGGGGGGRGGRGGGRGGSNLNLAIHFRRAENNSLNPFPTLGGTSTTTAWDVPVGYSFTKGGFFSTVRAQFNRQHSETTNLYAFNQDIAGGAGLRGVSNDPFDWGAPNISFSSFASLRDVNPASRTDQTIGLSGMMVKTRGNHTMRFGGDFRDLRTDSRTDANARGSYVFTGLFSGSDFGDFLLGLPQQATVQYGPGPEHFRSHTWDLFLQDDWRATSSLTVNTGLRYEYYSPYSEAANRLATLDVAPGFTAAAPVEAGQSGPYSGLLPDTIVRPYRGGLAPRVGIAWRPRPSTVVRAGYGINYSSSVYQSIAVQVAAQPPFASTDTVLATRSSPALLESVLTQTIPGAATNTYGVDPNYALGHVQIWNLDLQRDLTRTVTAGVGYVGTRGSDLDILRAPNRTATGLLIADLPPFIWESSDGASIMHSVSFRLRKRLTNGIAAGVAYTLSKSIDNASSIGGAGSVVAQNDQDLAAERGLSSFDQRHRVNGDFTFELPFGENRRWLTSGVGAALLGNWVLNGNVQLASGTPFTARILGAITDVSRGTNGTLRANYNGEPIALPDPTTTEFFNTAAFSVPAPGTFGNAGRNTIIGPGTSNVTLGVTRNLNLGQNRTLSVQLLANNVFNTVQYASIDTVVNSPTFGEVTAVRPMRRVQLLTRFRF